jgi:hypothetical protein
LFIFMNIEQLNASVVIGFVSDFDWLFLGF